MRMYVFLAAHPYMWLFRSQAMAIFVLAFLRPTSANHGVGVRMEASGLRIPHVCGRFVAEGAVSAAVLFLATVSRCRVFFFLPHVELTDRSLAHVELVAVAAAVFPRSQKYGASSVRDGGSPRPCCRMELREGSEQTDHNERNIAGNCRWQQRVCRTGSVLPGKCRSWWSEKEPERVHC